MTETLTTSEARPSAADSPLAGLFDIALAAGTPTEDEERDDAETTAAHHAWSQYTDTLGQVLDADDWRGYPAARPNNLEAGAAAWLDGGLWLHHTLDISETHGARDVLTLIAPCTCGRGYQGFELENETDLLAVLADLRPSGRAPHEGDSGGAYCASIPVQPFPALIATTKATTQ